MYLPKKDIKETLDTLEVSVFQENQAVFNELPAITFKVTNNDVDLFLDNTISHQNIEVQIDIWAESSVEASSLLSRVEEKMRNDLYHMNYSADVPNTGNIFHIVSRFNKSI